MCLLRVEEKQGWSGFVPALREITGDSGLTPNFFWWLLESKDFASALAWLAGMKQAAALLEDSRRQRLVLLQRRGSTWRPLIQGLRRYLPGSPFRGFALPSPL